MPDDFGVTIGSAGSVSVGGSSTGNIELSGDQDWFGVFLSSSSTYQIDLEGAPTSMGTLSDPYLRGIYDSGGSLVSATYNDDSGVGYNSLLEFTPISSGMYYLSAGGYSSHTGTYKISVTNTNSADDFGETTGSAGSLAVGSTINGNIEESGDTDWFAVNLTAGRTYQIDQEGSPTSAGTLSDTYLRGLYDSSGNVVTGVFNDDGGTGRNSLVEYTATSTGTYYISAGAYSSYTGTYQLSIEAMAAADDYGSTTGTAGSLPMNGNVTGEIEESGDTDWFAVNLTAGQTYEIGLQGSPTGGGTLSDTYLRGIYDSSGSILSGSTNDDGGDGRNSLLEFTATSSGTHYISAGAYSSNIGTYTLSIDGSGSRDDFADNTSTTGTVTAGGSATGSIEEANDDDWFAISMSAGQTYIIDLKGSPTNSGTLSDTYLNGIYNSAGNMMSGTANDDGGTGRNSQIEYTAGSNGTYYISAGGYSTHTGTYTLSVESQTSGDDYADERSTTGTVAVGGNTAGEIEESGDKDWFAVSLQAGRSYVFDLEGSPTGGGTLSDTYLGGIYDASGNLISNTSNDDGGSSYNSQVEFTATSTGTFYVEAQGYSSHTGTYKLSVTDQGGSTADDFSADRSTTGSLTVGGTANGQIEEAADQDWFAMTLQAGHTYQINQEGSPTSAGTLSDTYLRGVYDSSGNLISSTSNDDGGSGRNSLVEFTASSNGTYYVSAGAYSSLTGTYKVSLTDLGGSSSDDYAANTSTDGSVAVGGQRSGEIEESGDQDWFAVSLTSGQTYQIDLKGSPTSDGTLSDTYLRGIHDSSGNIIAGTTNDDGGSGANSQIEFTASSSGTYYIAAGAYSSRVGSYTVAVTETGSAPTPSGGFDINVDFTGDATYLPYFTAAAANWERIITGDLPDMNTSTAGLVDDLHINAAVSAIDGAGGILGQAGAREFRPGSNLPSVGMMQFDSADLAGMVASGTLGEVIEHEMGHVLGISSWVWNRMGGLVSGTNFVGSNAVAQYGRAVPLETGGGGGTAGSHWDEGVFTNELMTGYASRTAGMPTSVITVGALDDMGYTVNYSAADPYTIPSSLQFSGLKTAPIIVPTYAAAVASMVGNNFSGARVDYFEDKPVDLNVAQIEAMKLDGTVTSADENTVFFFDNTTGNSYFVELVGTFEKSSPATAGNVKGSLEFVRLFDGINAIAEYDFSDSPLDAQTALANWKGVGHRANNFVTVFEEIVQNDTIRTGAGNDVVMSGAGSDRVWGGAGRDQLDGQAGRDFLYGDGGKDKLYGNTGNDKLYGGGGKDKLFGDAGNDTLRGGARNDTLKGQGNADKLHGDAGNDILIGGAGRDSFFFRANGGTDTVRDFRDNVDTLKLDDNLWSGTKTKAQVINQFAVITNGNAVFTFDDGEKLKVNGVSDLGILLNDISII